MWISNVICPERVAMDDSKVQAVLKWPQPTTVKELQCFMGFENFYICMAKRLNPRQERWALFFTRCNFTVMYRPGSKNTKADALSWQYESSQHAQTDEPIIPSTMLRQRLTMPKLATYHPQNALWNGFTFLPHSKRRSCNGLIRPLAPDILVSLLPFNYSATTSGGRLCSPTPSLSFIIVPTATYSK